MRDRRPRSWSSTNARAGIRDYLVERISVQGHLVPPLVCGYPRIPSAIGLVPEETALHEGVDAAPQGLEQRRHHQRGGEVSDLGMLHVGEAEQQVLERQYADLEERSQHRRQQTSRHGQVDEGVYVVEAVLQDGY